MENGRPFGATDSPLVDFDAVCQKVRAAIEPARAHAVSLHDERGEVLWLSESSMGPDEHNAVREAIDKFAKPGGPPMVVCDLGDSRSALLLRAVNNRRALVGAIMVVIDARVVKPDARGALRVMTPKLHRALADFVEMLPDQAPAPTLAAAAARAAPAACAAPMAPVAARTSALPGVPPSRPSAAAVPVRPSVPPAVTSLGSAAGFTAKSLRATVTPEIDRLHAALRRSPIVLHVQRLVPLIKGSQLRRFEVLMRSKSDSAPNAAPRAMLKAAVEHGLGSMIDRRVLTELIGFLVRHPQVWKPSAAMFSVNLTTTALHDEHFIKFVELCLAKSKLPKGIIAFEVDAAHAVKLAATMSEVAASLHRLGCPLILDDFALSTECFALLRLPGVRYVKLAADVTAKMRTDKLSQAAITAVATPLANHWKQSKLWLSATRHRNRAKCFVSPMRFGSGSR
jgi:EAL domain-containing protein (putative c-di-GMP-specific phosphodiesterase class I)